MNNKAQATVFIIISLMVLAAAGIILYVNNLQQREEIAPGVFVAVEDIPTEIDPVNSFVLSCIDDVSTAGLNIIGQHAGYVDVSPKEFRINDNPTESDAVSFAPESQLKIPYWWHLSSNNECEGSCVFSSERPALRDDENSIESQLEGFIEKELPACLGNFESLREQGFEIDELSGINADVRIAEEDVVVILDYKLEVKKDDVESKLDQFFTRIPVNLEKIYNLATEITNMEQKYHFLERHAMNLVAAFSSVDENKLPPMTDMRFEFGSTSSWRKTEVKDRVSSLLASYISLFQVDGTKNFERNFYASELKQRLYDGMLIPIADPKYNDLDVGFSYLDFWPMYFEMDCKGEICQPESASSNILSFLGIQRYSFTYDMSYPVMVEISDSSALDGRGYRFIFFLESNVRNNKELNTDFIPLQTASIPQTSLLCAPENRNSAEVMVKILDSVEKMPLGDVSITLDVGGESCYIGKTDSQGILKAKFPSGAVGSTITMLKRDYISETKPFDAHPTRELSLEADLDPVKEKKLQVRKKLVEKTSSGWTFTNRIADLSQNEEAFVTLRRLSPLEEENFDSAAAIQGTSKSDIRLAPGKYEVGITMLQKDSLIIPSKKIRKKTGLFSEQEFSIPGVEFNENNPYPSGGLKLNITITEDDLKKDTITLFAVSPALQDVPQSQRTLEDLQQSSKIDEYSKAFAPLLKPIFQ